MKLSKDTWHYRNFEAWQYNSNSIHTRDLRPRYDFEPVTYDNGVSVKLERKLVEGRQPDLCTYTRIALFYGPWHRLVRWNKNHRNILSWISFSLIAYALLSVLSAAIFLSTDGENSPIWNGAEWVVWFLFPFAIAAAVLLVVSVIVLVAVGLSMLSDKFKDWRREHKYAVATKTKPPNILVERVKAHKQKICPMLEFED